MPARHKNKGLVNARMNAQSSLNLDGQGMGNLTGFKVKGQVTGDNGGVWNAVRSTTGNQANNVRLLLTTITAPDLRMTEKKPYPDKKDPVTAPPPDGTLTITLEKAGSADKTIDEDVDYADDTPP